MTDQKPKIKQFKKRLVGEPVVVGEYTLQPVAQVTGWYTTARGESGEGVGGWLRVTPVEVLVGKGEDETRPVPLTNETQATLQRIARGGLLIAALSWIVILAVKIFRGYREKRK
jgi:uncharacterized spore protein YtfJ